MHPLRGPIFETWVVSEIVKHRFNRGEHTGLYFYRDRQGLEADIVIEEGRELTVLEAKAGETATRELVGAGSRVQAVLENSSPSRRVVVYGGEPDQKRTNVEVISWNSVHQHRW
jgi:predicted AAA+ superfamily ATPase